MSPRPCTPPTCWKTRPGEWCAPPCTCTSVPSATTPATRPTRWSTAPTTRSRSGNRRSWRRSGEPTGRPSRRTDRQLPSSPCWVAPCTTPGWAPPRPPSHPPPPPLWCPPTPPATSPSPPPQTSAASPVPPGRPRTSGTARTPSLWRTSSNFYNFLTNLPSQPLTFEKLYVRNLQSILFYFVILNC